MKKRNIIISLLVLFLLSGCNSDDNGSSQGQNEALIFGWFGDSSCMGDCADIYKIEDGKIYVDVDYNYPENTFFEGNFQEVTNANYQDYKALLLELPNEIMNEPNGYLDCTTCTNENGGFYLELKDDTGFHKSWRFHNVQYPNYMENYRSMLIDKLADLNSL